MGSVMFFMLLSKEIRFHSWNTNNTISGVILEIKKGKIKMIGKSRGRRFLIKLSVPFNLYFGKKYLLLMCDHLPSYKMVSKSYT